MKLDGIEADKARKLVDTLNAEDDCPIFMDVYHMNLIRGG